MLHDAIAAQEYKFGEAAENMAFYRGLQYGQATRFGFYADDRAPGEEREVRNYIAPTVASLASARLRAFPSFRVTASSSDVSSLASARFQERLIRSLQQNGVVSLEEFYRGEIKRACHGAVWYKVYWDPNRGRSVRQPRFIQGDNGPEPLNDIFGRQQWWNAFEGDVAIEHCDIVDVLPDPHATRKEEVRHIFHRKLIPMSRALDRFKYDVFGNRLTAASFAQNEGYQEIHHRDSIENDARAHYSGLAGTRAGRSEGNQLARIVEFWVRPTNEFPDGALLVFSGNTIIAASPLPYDWPWVLSIGRNVLPSSLYADGDVAHLKSVQRSINLAASKMKEYMAMCAAPHILSPNDAGLSPADFSDIAGNVLLFSGTAGRPEWMSVPQMPDAVAGQEGHLRQQIGDIAAVSDIARGQVPPQIETGRALAYLYEFQQGAHEPDIALQREVYREVIQKTMALIHTFYQEGRMIALVGDNAAWEVVHFKRADFGALRRVVVEMEDQRPNSRAIQRAEAIEDFQIGAFSDTPEAKRYREAINAPSFGGEEVDVQRQHVARALEEQAGILDGLYPELLEQDDDEYHLQKHQAFAATLEFRRLPQEYQRVFLDHIAEHEARYVEQLEAQAALGAVGGAGQQQGGTPAKRPGLASPHDGGQTDIDALQPGGAAPSPEAVASDIRI